MAGIFDNAGRNFYTVAGVDGDEPAIKSPVQVGAKGYAVADGIVMGRLKGTMWQASINVWP